MTTWAPVLDGALAARAREALDDLGDALLRVPFVGPGLGPGAIGVALAHAYLEELRPDRGHLERAGDMFSDVLAFFTRQPLVPWLYEGWTGFGYLLEHFARHFGLELPPDEDPRLAMDESVRRLVASSPEIDGYEFCLGHAGHGLYALARAASVGPGVFEAVLTALEALATRDGDRVTWFAPHDIIHVEKERYPDGHYNLGVAHGVAGCLGVLVSAYDAGIARDRTRPLVEGCVRWLDSQRLPDGAPSVFPWIVAPGEPPRPARVAWCDGDPGVAAILIRAGRALGEPAIARRGLDVMIAAAARAPETTSIVDAGVCHGGAGLAHVYNRMAQETASAELAAAALRWYEWVLDQRRPGHGIGGFMYQHEISGEWSPQTGFSCGAAGTVLVLAAALALVSPAWDSLLLLS